MEKCNDCIYYLPHYIKFKDHYCRTHGHCTNKKPNGRFRKTDNICECFTQRDLAEDKKQQLKTTTECLNIIAQRIDELTQILKEQEAQE